MRNRVANSSKVIEKINCTNPKAHDNLDRLATHVLFVNRTSSPSIGPASAKQAASGVSRRSHEPQLHRKRLIVPARCWDTIHRITRDQRDGPFIACNRKPALVRQHPQPIAKRWLPPCLTRYLSLYPLRLPSINVLLFNPQSSECIASDGMRLRLTDSSQ